MDQTQGSIQEGYLCVHSSECVLMAPSDLECFSMIPAKLNLRHALVVLTGKKARGEPFHFLSPAVFNYSPFDLIR